MHHSGVGSTIILKTSVELKVLDKKRCKSLPIFSIEWLRLITSVSEKLFGSCWIERWQCTRESEEGFWKKVGAGGKDNYLESAQKNERGSIWGRSSGAGICKKRFGWMRTIVGRCRRGSDVSPSFATEAARREHCVASAQPFLFSLFPSKFSWLRECCASCFPTQFNLEFIPLFVPQPSPLLSTNYYVIWFDYQCHNIVPHPFDKAGWLEIDGFSKF